MLMHGMRMVGCAVVSAALLGTPGTGFGGSSQASQSRVEAALTNIMTLHRPGQDGLATIWDGNKYVQCRWMPERVLRCEAAGVLMQPSLGRVLGPERVARLAALGWHLDPSFGNHVQTFPGGLPVSQVADRILQALKEAYDADLANLDVQSDWIRSSQCPPRNGPSQNLAGMINDSPAMAATAVRGCAYKPSPDHEPVSLARTAADLITIYGARVSGEIQRLKVNIDRRVFVVLDTGGGYVQCGPQPLPQAIYCEAQSAESWPVLARILTPDRVARLHAAGFADPGRGPNYWKTYPAGAFSDTAIADELLTILHDVYGYSGSPKLEFKSEKGRH
jgi:hypothetical protein